MSKLYLLFITLVLISCASAEEDTWIAKVYEDKLLKEDLYQQIDNSLSPEDSTQVANSIIENWVKSRMLINQAERNLPDSLKDFTAQLEQEKNSLLLYTYQNEYVKQNLDTLIKYSEVETYYEQNPNSFVLKDYILQYSLVQVASEAENINKAEVKSLLENADHNIEGLRAFCSEAGAVYSLPEDTAQWWYLEEFLNNVPIEVYNNEAFLKKQKFSTFEADNFRYFVYIIDYKLKDEVSPIELVEREIRTLILNRRKQLLLKNLKTELYQKAVRENKITFAE